MDEPEPDDLRSRLGAVEAKLAESEAEVLALLDSIPSPTIGYDPESLRIVIVNAAAVQLYGFSRDELLSMSIADLRPEREVPALIAMLGHGVSSRAGVWKHRRKDGSLLDVEVFTHEAVLRGRKLRISITIDVTERMEREDRYREVFEHTSDGVFLLDVTDDGRFRIVAFNPAEEQLVGIAAADASGRFVDELLPPEVAQGLLQNYRRCCESGQAYSYTEDLAVPSGRKLFFTTLVPLKDERGICRRLIGVARNITEAVDATDARRESDERFRAAFQTIPDAINIGRLEDGVNIAVNDGFCRLTGWSEAEATGVRSSELDLWVDPQVRDELLERLAREGSVREVEVRFRAKSGVEFIGLLSSQVFSAAGRKCFLSVTHDITERRRAERAQTAVYRIAEAASASGTLQELLREIHQIVAELMPAPNFYIAIHDAAAGTIAFPYYLDELDPEPPAPAPLGNGLTEYVLRTGEPLLLQEAADFEALEQGGVLRLIGTRSSSWIGVPLRTNDRTVGMLAAQIYAGPARYTRRDLDLLTFVSTQVARTIERKQAEEATRESERRFRALIENSSDATIVCSPAGEVLYRSGSLERIMGYGESSPLGQMTGYVHAEDVADFSARWQEVLSQPGVPVRVETRMRHLDGSWRTLEGVCVNRIADPALRGVVVNFRDVSQRKQLQAQLLAADRMVSVGTLAAGVAHEINNPLSYVIANLALVADALGASELRKAHECLASAQEGAERVRQIVRGLKTFSRADETTLGPVDVNLVVDATANVALNEIRHRAHLQRNYGTGLPPARGNNARLGQVVLNLLVNAAQAIPESSEREKMMITVSTRHSEGRIVIEVSDTGTGIARENMARLFDPFFTTKPIGVGTGLGLYICQQLLAGMDGAITVESELGRGSTFRVSLPVAVILAGTPVPEAEPLLVRAAGVERRGRILTVDDEPQVGRVLQHTLKAHEVTSVNNAAAALELIRGGARFDLIICDLMMPGMTGMDLHGALSQEAPDQARRMIFLTGGAFTASGREFLDMTDAPQVEKPFEVRAMRALVSARLALFGAD